MAKRIILDIPDELNDKIVEAAKAAIVPKNTWIKFFLNDFFTKKEAGK